MRPLSLAALALASVSAVLPLSRPAPPSAPAIPPWSWSTVSTFVHCSNSSGPLNDDILGVMASSSWTVIEKFQCVACAPAGHGGEAKVLAAAAQIRARNPAAAIFFYFSAVIARTWYTLGDWFDAHPELEVHNANGSLATVSLENNSWHVWGFGHPAAVSAWVDDVAETVAKGNLQGVFIDGFHAADVWAQEVIPGANASEQAAWVRGAFNETGAGLARALPASAVRISNAHDGVRPPFFDAVSIEFFTPTNASIAQLEALAGTFAEVHSYVGSNATLFALHLSAFLLGAQERHYFGGGDTWDTCESWVVASQQADYRRPLGAPLAPAARAGSRITRAFASGTSAQLVVDERGSGVAACVRWADGATTGTAGGCEG
jgi:hypothetical protein